MPSIPEKRSGFERCLHATIHSCHGLKHAATHETAFRQEAVGACLSVPLAILVPLPLALRVAVVVCTLLMLITELLNSAVETVIDHISPEYNDFAKQAKDMGSAAVLLSLFAVTAAWVALLVTFFTAVSGRG